MSVKAKEPPYKIFLLDGFGALVSAVLLGIVLVQLESWFGIPPKALYLLAAIPCFFLVYDLFCFWNRKISFPKSLKGIALLNVAYCIFSIIVALMHSTSITWMGWSYITIEILIVLVLAFYEYRLAHIYSQ